MNTILKGDTSGDITLAMPETFDFTSKTVVLTYQGIARKFENVTPGASVTFSLSADETSSLALGVWPVEIAIVGKDGTRHVLNTSGIRIRVTDVPSEAYSGDVIPVNARSIFAGIADLPEEYTDRDVSGKIREILKRGGAAIMIALCALPALGEVLTVQTARKDAIYNYEQIVTNVTLDASAITPGNYDTVSNAAINAVQPTDLAAVATSGAYADLSGKPTIPVTASDVGAYPAADGNSLANIVNEWEGYWGGTNVLLEVTNYYGNTSGELPRLRIKELMESGEYAGTYRTVWDEANKFQVCESNLLAAVAASNETMRTELAHDFAPLAWGTVTDKGTTNVVGNSVWMTSPETYFAGGMEYQRVAVGSGSVCVLVDRGAGTYTAGEAGTFRFQDDGGTNYFGFAKSDSYTIGCNTDGITVSGNLVTLRYDVIMGGTDVPIVYWRLALSSGEWTQLNNADGTAADGSPYTVTWYTSGGSYYAAINCGSNATGFFKSETSVAGDVVFETNMRARLGGGIECRNTSTGVNGVIRPTFNGSTVNWTWSER